MPATSVSSRTVCGPLGEQQEQMQPGDQAVADEEAVARRGAAQGPLADEEPGLGDAVEQRFVGGRVGPADAASAD
jgi:hypothetical protein